MTFDNQVTGSFSDVSKLYDAEKENLLKTSPLTDGCCCSTLKASTAECPAFVEGFQ